jgi:hypothetical protein
MRVRAAIALKAGTVVGLISAALANGATSMVIIVLGMLIIAAFACWTIADDKRTERLVSLIGALRRVGPGQYSKSLRGDPPSGDKGGHQLSNPA